MKIHAACEAFDSALARSKRFAGEGTLTPPINTVDLTSHSNSTIDSHHLLVFCAVCKAGSITKAAHSLCLKRTALSHALKSLEMDLGCLLFYRHQKCIEITDAGARLFPKALEILSAMSDFRGIVQSDLMDQGSGGQKPTARA